nr:MAG TPA: hypothetical protein [Bacteriophage sp.]
MQFFIICGNYHTVLRKKETLISLFFCYFNFTTWVSPIYFHFTAI